MNNRARLLFPLLVLFLSTVLAAQEMPPCARPDLSQLTFPGTRTAQDRFYDKFDSLTATGKGNVNIWHIGGSHVQAGTFPNRIRDNIDSLSVRGNRGFLFPMKLAKTNSDRSYRISTTGIWEAPIMTKASSVRRPRYGITGYGARTSSPDASVSFHLNPSGELRWQCEILRVLGYGSSPNTYPYVICMEDTLRFDYDEQTCSYLFTLPAPTDTVQVRFHIPLGEEFVLNGLEPISRRPGVNFFASGVNGAALPSWLDKCEDLERDLHIVNPDLAIFGVGINDSATGSKDFSSDRFKYNYRRLIEMVRRVNPNCAFIFITNNDSYRYVRRGMTYNTNAEAVRTAMLELAEEFGGGVWDLYGVMGGAHSVEKWCNAGLVRKDRLHFTEKGYTLLGDLFVKALMVDHDHNRKED